MRLGTNRLAPPPVYNQIVLVQNWDEELAARANPVNECRRCVVFEDRDSDRRACSTPTEEPVSNATNWSGNPSRASALIRVWHATTLEGGVAGRGGMRQSRADPPWGGH